MMHYDDEEHCSGYIHVIEAGDTLYKLARKYDVQLWEIMRLNPYVDIYNLQIGDEICIPTYKYPNHGVPLPMKPDRRVYVVKDGDTIKNVLDLLKTDIVTLMKENPNLYQTKLAEGTRVSIPLTTEAEQK